MPMVVGDNGGDNVGENTCDDEVTVGSHYMHAILFKGLKKQDEVIKNEQDVVKNMIEME